MNKENWSQAKEIFYSALHKPADERKVFLSEVCADDSELLNDVKILLDSYQSGYLEKPILDFYENSTAEKIPIIPQFQTGDHFNHYIILRMLGRGGMGEVYLAKDKKLDRLVAVKVLLQGADEKAEKRLLREARTVAELNHQNICLIYEVGKTANLPFIIMQYIEGKTLEEIIKSKPLSVDESISIVLQIAEALGEAHSHNIIHRDIKPSNIIIDSTNQVKVLDFSLAKKIHLETDGKPESLLSEIGVIAGTVAYMSPEQLRGQEADHRCDIWSLGVVLYEMLTGNLPFTGGSKNDIIAAILTKDALGISTFNIAFPFQLESIINKSLQKNRDERFSSIRYFFSEMNLTKGSIKSNLKLAKSTASYNPIRETASLEFSKPRNESKISADVSSAPLKFILKSVLLTILLIGVFVGGIYWFRSSSSESFTDERKLSETVTSNGLSTMTNGLSDKIEYTWTDGIPRFAIFLPTYVNNPGESGQNTHDPNWYVWHKNDSNQDDFEWLNYISDSGQTWSAKLRCQYRSQNSYNLPPWIEGNPKIDVKQENPFIKCWFEHKPYGGGQTHNDIFIRFLDWNREPWEAEVNAVPGIQGQPTFTLKKL